QVHRISGGKSKAGNAAERTTKAEAQVLSAVTCSRCFAYATAPRELHVEAGCGNIRLAYWQPALVQQMCNHRITIRSKRLVGNMSIGNECQLVAETTRFLTSLGTVIHALRRCQWIPVRTSLCIRGTFSNNITVNAR